MKKIIFILATIFVVVQANAQKKKANTTTSKPITKTYVSPTASSSSSSSSSSSDAYGFSSGDFVVSGVLGYVSQGTAGSKEGTFAIQPSMAYFIKDEFAIGSSLGFKRTTSTPNGGTSTSASEFGVGLFGRYYFKPQNQFSVFGQAGFDFTSQKQDGVTGSVSKFGLGIKPGISYFVSNHFALEATIGELGFASTSADGASSTTDFTFGFNFSQISLGLVYKF